MSTQMINCAHDTPVFHRNIHESQKKIKTNYLTYNVFLPLGKNKMYKKQGEITFKWLSYQHFL